MKYLLKVLYMMQVHVDWSKKKSTGPYLQCIYSNIIHCGFQYRYIKWFAHVRKNKMHIHLSRQVMLNKRLINVESMSKLNFNVDLTPWILGCLKHSWKTWWKSFLFLSFLKNIAHGKMSIEGVNVVIPYTDNDIKTSKYLFFSCAQNHLSLRALTCLNWMGLGEIILQNTWNNNWNFARFPDCGNIHQRRLWTSRKN
jgi:hypothetical protein